MIRVEKNNFINQLVKEHLIPESISCTSPIIAGGSILHLYLNYFDESSNNSKYLKSWLEKAKKLRFNKHYMLDFNQNEYHGDIDIWYSSEEDLNGAILQITKDCPLKSDSNWASTHRRWKRSSNLYNKVSEIQIIKKIAETPEQLISSFDIANSMIAWHDDKLYIDSRLDEAFEAREVRYVNSPFKGNLTIASKIFNVLRLFKYAKRYSLSFSKEIDDIILNLYMEVDDLDLRLYDKRIEIVNNVYGKKYTSVSVLKRMIKSFANYFPIWYVMNTFREENLAFFVTVKSVEMNPVLHFVKSIMNSDSQTHPF